MTTRPNPPPESVPAQNAGHSTGDYSPTKAPENQPHVESAVPTDDPRVRPGGAHGAPMSVGMDAFHADTGPRKGGSES
jgi:hypothetical protein